MIRSVLILSLIVLIGMVIELSSCGDALNFKSEPSLSFIVEVEFTDGTVDTLRIFSHEPPYFSSEGSVTTVDDMGNITTHATFVRKYKLLKTI